MKIADLNYDIIDFQSFFVSAKQTRKYNLGAFCYALKPIKSNICRFQKIYAPPISILVYYGLHAFLSYTKTMYEKHLRILGLWRLICISILSWDLTIL